MCFDNAGKCIIGAIPELFQGYFGHFKEQNTVFLAFENCIDLPERMVLNQMDVFA